MASGAVGEPGSFSDLFSMVVPRSFDYVDPNKFKKAITSRIAKLRETFRNMEAVEYNSTVLNQKLDLFEKEKPISKMTKEERQLANTQFTTLDDEYLLHGNKNTQIETTLVANIDKLDMNIFSENARQVKILGAMREALVFLKQEIDRDHRDRVTLINASYLQLEPQLEALNLRDSIKKEYETIKEEMQSLVVTYIISKEGGGGGTPAPPSEPIPPTLPPREEEIPQVPEAIPIPTPEPLPQPQPLLPLPAEIKPEPPSSPPQPLPPPSPIPTTTSETEEPIVPGESEALRNATIKKKQREQQLKGKLELYAQNREHMRAEFAARQPLGFFLSIDLFFRTVLQPYLYWMWGMHQHVNIRRKLDEAEQKLRNELYTSYNFYWNPKPYEQAPKKLSPAKLMTKRLMFQLKTAPAYFNDKTKMSFQTFQNIIPLGADQLWNTYINFQDYQNIFEFESDLERLVLMGRTFAQEEKTAAPPFSNYFHYFWIPENSQWKHELDSNTIYQKHTYKNNRTKPLWNDFYFGDLGMNEHDQLSKFIFNNTVFIPYFYCVTSDEWLAKSIFSQLAQHIRFTLRSALVGLSEEELGKIPVVFGTHIHLVSQIVILWSAGMRYLNFHKQTRPENVFAIPEYSTRQEKLLDFDTIMMDPNAQIFKMIPEPPETPKKGEKPKQILKRNFHTSLNRIHIPYHYALNYVTNTELERITPIDPIGVKLFEIEHFGATTRPIPHYDIQNTIYFTSTIDEMLQMERFTPNQLEMIKSAAMEEEEEALFAASSSPLLNESEIF